MSNPNWDLVPFEVSCARCGHDLRHLTDPVCTACQLEFDWSVAVPIEQLTCVECDYHLYGLTETRCPECGTDFTWDQALDTHYKRKRSLFEYRWREQPVRSFIRTAYLMFRPRLLWQQLDIHDQPRVKPLIVNAALAYVVMAALLPLLAVVYMWVAIGPVAMTGIGTQTVGNYLSSLWLMYTSPVVFTPVVVVAVWSLMVLGSLLLFRQSMKRHRVRSVQVLRVWTHCVPVTASLMTMAVTTALLSILAAGYDLYEPTAFLVPVAISLYTCFLLQEGYKRYLKMRHAWGIAVAAHLVAALATMVVGTATGLTRN